MPASLDTRPVVAVKISRLRELHGQRGQLWGFDASWRALVWVHVCWWELVLSWRKFRVNTDSSQRRSLCFICVLYVESAKGICKPRRCQDGLNCNSATCYLVFLGHDPNSKKSSPTFKIVLQTPPPFSPKVLYM